MAKRSVELSIQLQNAKSISDLDQVLKDINKELKQVDVGSEAFNELSALAKKADNSLKSIKDDLRGISDEKQLDSVAKLGGALAGGLSVATVAASKFGDQSEEAILKTIQTATELSVVLNSIKPILEGIQGTNRRAFGEFISNFKKAGIGAKLFGDTTRTAITSTGIGLLIIALGTLIANWDSVTKAVKEFGDSIPFIKKITDGVQELVDKVGSLSNLFQASKAFIVGLFTAGKSAVDEFNKALETGKAISVLEKQFELIEEQNAARERQIKLLEVQGKNEQKIIDLKRESFQAELTNLETRRNLGEALNKDQLKRIEDLKLELDLLDIRAKKLGEDAKRAAFDRANAEGKIKVEQERLAQSIADAEADKERERNQKLQDDLLKQYKVRLDNEIKVYGEIEEEKVELTKEQQKELDDLNVDRLEQFKETLSAVEPFIQATLDGINQISQSLTDALSREMESLNLELDILNTRFQETAESRKSFEAELAETQGAAREQLIASIDEERKKEKQLAEERKKIQNQLITAQNKANQVDYVNDLINATVNTALGVTKALASSPPPANFALAAIVGALGAAQIGVIASNKPEPIPTFAKGGFTTGLGMVDSSGYQVAGVVHENEYVVPEKVLDTGMGSSLVAVLEAMRIGMPTFADGGFSGPSLTPDSGSIGLTGDSLKAAIESARIFVSVQEVRDTQTNVTAIENRAAA